MYLNYYIYIIMFIISIMMFCLYLSSCVIVLMVLEMVMLSTLLMMLFLSNLSLNANIVLYFAVFAVCEAVLGFIMLVKLMRANMYGSTSFLNLIMW